MATNTTIDTLEVKISANAQAAVNSLKSLSKALQSVKTALTGVNKDGVSASGHIAKSLNEMNGALNTITTSGIKRIQKLANGLNDYADALKKVKAIGSTAGVAKGIDALGGNSAAKQVQETKEALGLATKEDTAVMTGGSGNTYSSEDLKKMGVFSRDAAKGVEKLKKEIGAAGQKAKSASGFFGKLVKSIGRVMLYRAIRSAIKAVAEAFSEGLKNAYMFSKQNESFTRLAETLDRLKSITAQMVNQLGAFWGEFRQFIQPAIEWLIEKVRRLSEWLTELFAALNGEKTYLQAQYVAQEWDEATDNVKKYKQQLLGLDELNNLSSKESSGKEATDYSTLYKEVSVSDGLLKVGAAWGALKGMIEESLTEIELALGGFLVGVGAALLFSGANIPLGLGLIVAGGFMAGKAIKEKWDELGSTIEGKLGRIETMLGGFTLGLGAVLAFSGANIPLGIGLMVGGAAVLAKGVADLNWNKLNKKTKTKVARLTAIISGALLAVGAVLAFSGVSLKLGIPLMAAGAVGLATTVALNWDTISKDVEKAFQKFAPLFAAIGIGSMAVGTVLLFTGHIGLGLGLLIAGGFLTATTIAINWQSIKGYVEQAFVQFRPLFLAVGLGSMVIGLLLLFTGNIGLGLGLLVGGGFLTATTIVVNWDGILNSLKLAWANIKNWWNSNVKGGIHKAINWVEESISLDLNGDGKIGGLKTDYYSTIEQSSSGKVHGGTSYKFAAGGMPEQGSLFYAGERGPEFIGAMGSSSAVANTEQMTDAIYKAAYMGMSRALAENGGMNGFEPATTDDLYIAIKKKSNAFSKRTGIPSAI